MEATNKENTAASVTERDLDARTAFTIAMNMSTGKLPISRAVRKRVEGTAPITVKSAAMALTETADAIMLTLHANMVRGTNTQIVFNWVSYPKNWRQHLKMAVYDKLPDWAAEMFERWSPVVMHKEEVPFEQHQHFCPHVSFPSGSAAHAKWLISECEGTDQMLESLESLLTAAQNQPLCISCRALQNHRGAALHKDHCVVQVGARLLTVKKQARGGKA